MLTEQQKDYTRFQQMDHDALAELASKMLDALEMARNSMKGSIKFVDNTLDEAWAVNKTKVS